MQWKRNLTVIAVCVGLLWLGEAHAARFETHATNAAVPEGTVYDTTTDLLWEMKTPAGTGGVHDVNNYYTWSSSGADPNGTAFTQFLSALNGGDYYDPSLGLVVNTNPTSCFTNHCDWRLPTTVELKGIVDSSRSQPSIDPIFGPTQSSYYWSATTNAGFPGLAWDVYFSNGFVFSPYKSSNYYVRAVRSGL
ncbi:MAG: DUF1566 domain-containing protein [Candidatus Binataceae bacterium]